MAFVSTTLSCVCALGIGAAMTAMPALAEDASQYPTYPIHLVVGFGAGGGNDLIARVVSQKLSERLGQPVIVDNKPGGGGIAATEFVARARPDGYTLLVGATGHMTIAQAVYEKLSYDTLRDFIPISEIAYFPLILVVNTASSIKSMQDLVAYAKANPGKANYASSSPSFQLTTELFKLRTGAPIEYIPYKSSNESVVAVISGEVTTTIADTPPVAGQLQGGRIRALAVTAPKRVGDLPDVPTMDELGVTGVDVLLWNGLFAPKGTPAPIVQKLEEEMMQIVQMPETRERFKALSISPAGTTAAAFSKIIADEIVRWKDVAKASNVSIHR